VIDLSIVIPTCNRARLLDQTIEQIIAGTQRAFELIIVDGASNDGTGAVLARTKERLKERSTVIREERRRGFVRAANVGFAAARGRNLTWLNDDARPLPGALDLAVEQIDAAGEEVAFVAMFHRWQSTTNIAYQMQVSGRHFALCHVRGTLIANFPVGRTGTFERLGYFDESYFVAAAEADLSLKAWHSGMRIVPACGAAVDHDEVYDSRRLGEQDRADADNRRLFAKWDLPPRGSLRTEFDPLCPCTLRKLNSAADIAANLSAAEAAVA
jgi:GT2 family glycosyltransferase